MGGASRTLLFGVVWSAMVAGVFAQEGTLLVANRSGGSISFVDFPTKIEVARLPIGPAIPHEVAVSPDGRLALTGEYGPENRHGQHVVLSTSLRRASSAGSISPRSHVLTQWSSIPMAVTLWRRCRARIGLR